MKLILIPLLQLLSSSFSGEPLPNDAPLHYECHYTTSAPQIDGILDDECWEKALTASFKIFAEKIFQNPLTIHG